MPNVIFNKVKNYEKCITSHIQYYYKINLLILYSYKYILLVNLVLLTYMVILKSFKPHFFNIFLFIYLYNII